MTAESSKNQRPDRYNAREAEPCWQKAWDEAGIFATPNEAVAADSRVPVYRRHYVLELFSYPSVRIHMGNSRCLHDD